MARNFQPEKRERAGTERAKKFRRQLLFGWAFAVFWFAFVATFDVYLVNRFAKQLSSASSWQQTTGVIQSSKIVTGHTSKGGKTYRPEISYTYSVDGRAFSSSIIAAGGTDGFGNSDSTQIVQANPVDATVPVYYDPSDPSDAALMVGLQPRSFMMVIFLIPFNAVLLAMVVFLRRAHRYAGDPLLGRIVMDDGNRAVLRMSQITPLTAGCLGAGIAGFIGIFVAAFAWSGQPPLHIAATILGSALAVGCLAAFWRSSAIASGKYDIELDRTFKRITLPHSRKSYNQESLRFADLIIAIELDSKRKMNKQSTWKLHLSGKNEGDSAYTAIWLTSDDARTLAKWLSKQTGVPFKRDGGIDSED